VPDVPFPRTVPDDAPTPPAPLLDQRAARTLFAELRRNAHAVGYRLSADGVTVHHADTTERFFTWAEVLSFARGVHGLDYSADRDSGPDADDPTRRQRRQQRRRDR
jgi:hypothetical protein